MAAPRVVPALDEVENREAGLGRRAEPVPVEQLALERREEALAERVVVGVAHAPHRGPSAGLPTAATEGEGGVLAALVRVMNHVARPAVSDGHIQRGQDQLRLETGFHPISRRLHASRMTARYRKPAQVGT